MMLFCSRRKAFLFALLTGFAYCLNYSVVEAHQQKEAYTTVLFNLRTDNIEVSHRFRVHDAEHVLNVLFNSDADLVNNEATQNQFAAYIQSTFSVTDELDKPLLFETVGHEIDAKFFWVYQETPISDYSAVRIKQTALQEIWSNQINHINVEKDGWVRSLRLVKGDSYREISLITKEAKQESIADPR